MKSIFILVTLLLLSSAVPAQEYEPSILILAPHASEVDKKLQKELNEINAALQPNKQPRSTEDKEGDKFVGRPENLKLMTSSEGAFSEERDFIKMTSYFAYQYLTYRFYERFQNLLILLSKSTSSGHKTELTMQADSAKTQYVLNFPSISLFRKGGLSYAKVRVQLFDRASGEHLIDTEFTSDSNNPGFEFACKTGSLHCTINNALSQALADVIDVVSKNSPALQRERWLQQERYEVLINDLFKKSGSLDLVKQVIHSNAQIPVDNIFHVLYDGSGTKFVAFSLEQVDAQSLKTLTDIGKDRNVKIITDKSLKDPNFLASTPQTYAFIIKGVKFEGKWYYEKANVTYFEAESVDEGRRIFFNNLQNWNFFMENSTMVSPNFWETALFEKVPDLRQHPDWLKYGDGMWKTEEKNNRGYIGTYEIVANGKRREKQAERELFETQVKNNILTPSYERLKEKDPKKWADYYSDRAFIYSGARDVVINPVLVTDDKGVKTIHYFLAFTNANEIFEWTYFPVQETRLSRSVFGTIVVDQLESITEWDYSYNTLDDEEFWRKYVVLKEGDKFKYLRKVEL